MSKFRMGAALGGYDNHDMRMARAAIARAEGNP
jgi:hypothetical protein